MTTVTVPGPAPYAIDLTPTEECALDMLDTADGFVFVWGSRIAAAMPRLIELGFVVREPGDRFRLTPAARRARANQNHAVQVASDVSSDEGGPS